ncbi:UDP-galactose-lipid carrier transferase [bacterium]|nr:UDP-galactose-lipid carrier transferase [bacterium]
MSKKSKNNTNGKPGRLLSLADLDLARKIKHKEYDAQLYQLQIDLVRLQRLIVDTGMRVVIIFEGMDAAGKGGAIKRLVQFLDPRGLEVHAIGAPSPQELSHHYLRRFWLRLPSKGRIAIFDRSWYGRMLVEPIEGFNTPEEYERSKEEIRQFEKHLADDHYCLMKFWLHIDKDEQFRRFKSRTEDPLKKWKITKEDWRNREKYDEYFKYAEAMFKETDAPHAPWFLVPGNSKLYSRIMVLSTVVEVLDNFRVP